LSWLKLLINRYCCT